MSRILTIPVMPDPKRTKARRAPRISNARYLEGQKLLAEAIKYLAQSDPVQNKDAVTLLSEHFRTQFRMDDRPS